MRDNNLPLIVDIKRDSHEDGPGIRSVVFFKGCPLRCTFCHNPETQDPNVDIAFRVGQCLRCGKCAESCPQEAIDLSRPEHINRDRCVRCGHCVDVCPANALSKIGRYYPVDSLVEILMRDLPFYRHSNGGVTISGGECTLYPDYLESLLTTLKTRGVHLVLETCGYFDFDIFERKILPYIDLIYYDIKIADPEMHSKFTGRRNKKILSNLRCLILSKPQAVYPRIPLIPGVTATGENLSAIVDILVDAGVRDVTLVPFNPLGMDMAVSLGRPKSSLPHRFMTPDEEKEIHLLFRTIVENRRRCHE